LGKIVLSGTIISGKGEGKKFVNLPWVIRQIKKTLGFKPYPGTLNVLLSNESSRREEMLNRTRRITILAEDGYCNGVLIRSTIDNIECAIVIPEIANYPKEILEIIAPMNLRELFKLEDGDEIRITVNQLNHG